MCFCHMLEETEPPSLSKRSNWGQATTGLPNSGVDYMSDM